MSINIYACKNMSVLRVCVYLCIKMMENIVLQTCTLNSVIYFNTSNHNDCYYYCVLGTGLVFNLHSNTRRYYCHSPSTWELIETELG